MDEIFAMFPVIFTVVPFPFYYKRNDWSDMEKTTLYAIAAYGKIAIDEYYDGIESPSYWATHPEELQAMIDEKDERLLYILKHGPYQDRE